MPDTVSLLLLAQGVRSWLGDFALDPAWYQVMRPLPRCEPQRPSEDTIAHGTRILAFLFAENCTATLTDLELERAEYAAQFASTARDISPIAADTISRMRHLIGKTLRCRAHWRGAEAVPVPVPDHTNDPPIGPMARRETVPVIDPIVPRGAVKIDF
jgi:hypothetical protein